MYKSYLVHEVQREQYLRDYYPRVFLAQPHGVLQQIAQRPALLELQEQVQVPLALVDLEELDSVTAEPETALDSDLVDHLHLFEVFPINQL